MSAMLFHATTLQPTMWELEAPVVSRNRVLRQINTKPHNGIISWMIGPLGSGKSTIAFQWAEELDTEVQLVSARSPILREGSQLHPPSEFGLAIENLLNICSDERELATAEDISAHLDRVVELSIEQSQPFILDDLEMIHRDSMNILIGLFAHALPLLRVNRALFISRTIDSIVMEGLQSQRSLRIVLPATLEFDQDEAASAQQLGVFGTASLEQVENARKQSAGWITGMLTELHGHGGHTIAPSLFRTNVLNNMVLQQPMEVLRAMIASAHLPLNTLEIWEKWFTNLGVPHWAIPSTLAQLPIRAHEGATEAFGIVPALAEVLRNVRSITVSNYAQRDLMLIAMEWYIDNGLTDAAITLARDQSLQAEYMRLIKPRARELSRAEEWQVIATLVEELPRDLIITDPDISFWYSYALASKTRWSDVIDIQSRGDAAWRTSESQIVRGRNLLMIGSIFRSKGDYEEALLHFEQAYDTLPSSAHQERMYAAASAGTSASQIRLGQESLPWRKRTAFELAHLPPRQRWWHGNMGPIALGYVASSGRPELAYSQAKQQVEGLQEVGPDLSWRYLLLMATIDIEQMRLDSATEAIERSRLYIHSPLQQLMISIAESKLLAAQGNYSAAMTKLDSAPYSAGRSINSEFFSKLTLARHAFDSGDVAKADFTLGNAAWPSDPWPRNFGDPHPNLILAMIRAEMGDIDKGLTLVDQVLQEARYRRDRFLEIRSHTVLAHIHHESGNVASRDHDILTALDRNSSAGYQLVFHIKGQDVRTLAENIPTVAVNDNSHTRLTFREAEVLDLVAQSFSNKQIAAKLYISISTVKNHLASVYDKLGTNTRHHAVERAEELGLLED